jgi:hypothetical protein
LPKKADVAIYCGFVLERIADGRVSFNHMTVGYCHQQTRGNRQEAIMIYLVEEKHLSAKLHRKTYIFSEILNYGFTFKFRVKNIAANQQLFFLASTRCGSN